MEDKILSEVYGVIKCLKTEDLNKIPLEIRDVIECEMDKNYKFTYEFDKNLKEQNISRKARAILAYLNLRYLLNDEEKRKARKKYISNEIIERKKLSIDVDVNEIFKSKNKKDYENENNSLTEGKDGLLYIIKIKLKEIWKNIIKK